MVHVIGYPKTAPNHIGDSGIRPSIGRIAVDRSAAEKNAAELLPIVHGQFAWAPRSWYGRDTFDSSTAVRGEPAMDRPAIDTQPSSYSARTNALLEKLDGLNATPLKGSGISAGSHVTLQAKYETLFIRCQWASG